MTTDLYRRAFARAASILGGKDELAKYLRSDSARVSKWSSFAVLPPVHVLQSIAHLLKDELLKKYKRAPASVGIAKQKNVIGSGGRSVASRRALSKALLTRNLSGSRTRRS
jgi:hypothetical protein